MLISSLLRRISPVWGFVLGAVSLVAADVSYRRDWQTDVPWSVQIARLDLGDSRYTVYAPLARGTVAGLATLSEMARQVPPAIGKARAGVNGDFYQREGSPYTGDPRGLQIVNGELASGPGRAGSVWMDAAGRPHAAEVTGKFSVTWADGSQTPFGLNEARTPGMAVLYTGLMGRTTATRGGRELILERDGVGPWVPLAIGETYRARVREVREQGNTALTRESLVLSLGIGVKAVVAAGDTITLSTATAPDLKGAVAAIGGGAVLVRDGKSLEIPKPAGAGGYEVASQFQRHPRSAVGWNEKELYLVQVDGRQPGLSIGMTLAELGEYMRTKLACTEVISLDGGGSATFRYDGRVRNSPCDGNERPIANSLLIIEKNKP